MNKLVLAVMSMTPIVFGGGAGLVLYFKWVPKAQKTNLRYLLIAMFAAIIGATIEISMKVATHFGINSHSFNLVWAVPYAAIILIFLIKTLKNGYNPNNRTSPP
jgi:hypothetical protein